MDYLLLAIGMVLTGLCEYLAAALFSMPPSVINALADEGSAVGQRLRRVIDEPEEARLSISLIDVVLLIATTVGVFALAMMHGSQERAMWEAVVFAAGIIAVKTLAAVIGNRYADRMLRATSIMMTLALVTAKPFVWAHRMLMDVTKTGSNEEEAREELEALVETARDEGALDPGEYRIMTNIMRLSSIEVSDVMTPRLVVFGLQQDTTITEAIKNPELQMYSRFPVFEEESLDTVSGYVMTKDVLRAALAGRQSVELSKLKRDVAFVPENASLDQALEQFLQKRQHLFMVVDEYGGVEGLITMEDVMESVLGVEIVDEADHVVDLRAVAKQRRDARIAAMAASSQT